VDGLAISRRERAEACVIVSLRFDAILFLCVSSKF
jgi:hypothetical protein